MRILTQGMIFIWIAVASLLSGHAVAFENLTIKALPSVALSAGRPLPLTVIVGQNNEPTVRIGFVSLIERQSKRPISTGGLRICHSGTGACATDFVELPANRSYNLFIWGIEDEGVFEGTVTISTASKPAGETSPPMTVYVSSAQAKFFGVLTIASSVIVAFLFSVILRSMLNRRQLLLPVASLRDTLSLLKARVLLLPASLQSMLSKTVEKIAAVDSSLQTKSLSEAGLPSILPSFTSGASLDSYRAYISAKSQWTQILSIVIDEGLRDISNLLSGGGDSPVPPAALKAAVDAIEAAAQYHSSAAPNEAALRLTIASAIQDLKNAMQVKSFFSQGKSASYTEQLRLEIGAINVASWLFVLVLTTFIGAVAIVVMGDGALGFGTAGDYLKCVLWGLGFPVGSQLASITSATVSTTYAVPKPA